MTNNAAVEETVCVTVTVLVTDGCTVDVLVTVDLALVHVVNFNLDLAGMRQ